MPAIPLLYFSNTYSDVALFVLIVLAVISDAEGELARRTGTTTNLGRVFDPLADKFFTNTMLIAHVFTDGSVATMVLLVSVIAYDVDNTAQRIRDIVAGCMGGGQLGDSRPTTLLSKAKTCVLYGLVIVLYTPHELFAFEEWQLQFLSVAAGGFVLGSWWNNRRDFLLGICRRFR